ncbi:hypothetical protein Ari01nite_87970 [Paractinoplanes rishiriensis]|uniref:Uncharacterized protein n=1 Tax=Paractinoplanes rishiriensis TaxID=1050105 RepID=A0A919N2Q3_9ACTN|nr:hypothetical protein Ari01nite_87970 [Actinoplanes rishiriensis]
MVGSSVTSAGQGSANPMVDLLPSARIDRTSGPGRGGYEPAVVISRGRVCSRRRSAAAKCGPRTPPAQKPSSSSLYAPPEIRRVPVEINGFVTLSDG